MTYAIPQCPAAAKRHPPHQSRRKRWPVKCWSNSNMEFLQCPEKIVVACHSTVVANHSRNMTSGNYVLRHCHCANASKLHKTRVNTARRVKKNWSNYPTTT